MLPARVIFFKKIDNKFSYSMTSFLTKRDYALDISKLPVTRFGERQLTLFHR